MNLNKLKIFDSFSLPTYSLMIGLVANLEAIYLLISHPSCFSRQRVV